MLAIEQGRWPKLWYPSTCCCCCDRPLAGSTPEGRGPAPAAPCRQYCTGQCRHQGKHRWFILHLYSQQHMPAVLETGCIKQCRWHLVLLSLDLQHVCRSVCRPSA